MKNVISDQFRQQTRIKFAFPPQPNYETVQYEQTFIAKVDNLEEVYSRIDSSNIRCSNINFITISNQNLNRFWNIISESDTLYVHDSQISQNQLLNGLDKLLYLRNVSLDFDSHYDVIEVIDRLINRVESLTVSGNTWGRLPLIIHHDIEKLPCEYKPAIKELKFLTPYNFCNPHVTKLFKVIQLSLKHLEICLMWYNIGWCREFDQLQWFSDFDFNLESFKLKLIGGTNFRTLQKLVAKQNDLKHFEISWDIQISKIHFESITRHMVNLRVLRLDSRAFAMVDYNILDLTKLRFLEVRKY